MALIDIKRARLAVVGAAVFFASPLFAAESAFPIFNALFPASNSVDFLLHGTPETIENRIRGTFLISQTSTETWSIQQTVGELDLDRPLTIEQTGVAIPQTLWDIETGAGYRRKISDRRDWGISASIGSASDKPYNSLHETTLRLTGVYRLPSQKENAWLFLISYSNNRHFANNVPLPGVAYIIHAPARRLDAVIGFPFMAVNWKPGPRSNARVSVFGPRNLSLETSYTPAGPLETYAGFDWNEKSWLRANRPDNRNHLFLEQKKWSLGMRVPIYRLRLDVGTGYEFNRRFYENDKVARSPLAEAGLRSAWTFQTKLGFRW